MHAIQKDILRRITLQPEARYSDLKSDDIDGNLFMYHLNQLMSAGYIEKDDKVYRLSDTGRQLITTMSTATGEQRSQPRISVVVVAEQTNGEHLLFEWIREPNTGLVSLPHGNLHFGESVFTAAERELTEKTGHTAELTYRGGVYLKTLRNEQIFNHQLLHIFEATNIEGTLNQTHRNGKAFWGSLENMPEVQTLPGTWEILDTLKANPDHFLVELEVSFP